MTLFLQPVQVATGWDEEGMLVFSGKRLVAVLVHLAEDNEVAPGHWYLEAGFGHGLDGRDRPTFADLDAAQAWIEDRLAKRGVTRMSKGQA